jgi:hypothetical protein
MIVLDEQLNDPLIIKAIERWYPGQVVTINAARPDTRIHDDEIPELLHHLKSPIFLTINYTDFWRKLPAHRRYCAICLKLSIERKKEVPAVLRELLKLDNFDTKRKLMGKVISVSEGIVRYYE